MTRFGGEGSLFTRIEVGDHAAVSRQVLESHRNALDRLVNGQEGEDLPRLSGPIADRLRADASLRGRFARPEQNGNGIWVQISPAGEIRQLAVFDHHHPARVLLAKAASGKEVFSGAYDFEFNAAGELSGVRFFSRGGRGPWPYRIQPGDAYFNAFPDAGRYELFSIISKDRPVEVGTARIAGASTELSVSLQRVQGHQRQGLEVRDRAGNILLALTPSQVLASPAQRLFSLFDFSDQHVSEQVRRSEAREIRDLIRELARRPYDDPVRRRAVEEVGSTPVSIISRLLDLMRETHSVEERGLLGEMMAHREIVGFGRRHRMERYWVLDSLSTRSPSEPQDPAPSAVLFYENGVPENGNGSAPPNFPRLMIRSRSGSNANYLATFQESVQQLGRVLREHPEARDNVIQVTLERNNTLYTNDDIYSNYLRDILNVAMEDAPQDLR
ncbi:MAG: hypothetical protein ACREP8_16350, partial [Candidatus Binatia bacterium]